MIGLTGLGIKPESTTPAAYALTTRPSKLLKQKSAEREQIVLKGKLENEVELMERWKSQKSCSAIDQSALAERRILWHFCCSRRIFKIINEFLLNLQPGSQIGGFEAKFSGGTHAVLHTCL